MEEIGTRGKEGGRRKAESATIANNGPKLSCEKVKYNKQRGLLRLSANRR